VRLGKHEGITQGTSAQVLQVLIHTPLFALQVPCLAETSEQLSFTWPLSMCTCRYCMPNVAPVGNAYYLRSQVRHACLLDHGHCAAPALIKSMLYICAAVLSRCVQV
jgi:hypothetical protein